MNFRIHLLMVVGIIFLLLGGCGSNSNGSQTPGPSFVVLPADLGADGVWATDEVWHRVNLRSDATLNINSNNPNNGDGSLEFTSVVATNGQDKADLQNLWDPVDPVLTAYPNRTIADLTALSYDFYRASSSTILSHFAPVFVWLFTTLQTAVMPC